MYKKIPLCVLYNLLRWRPIWPLILRSNMIFYQIKLITTVLQYLVRVICTGKTISGIIAMIQGHLRDQFQGKICFFNN